MLAGWHDADPLEGPRPNTRWRPTQGFFALILLVEAMVVLSFEATDVFLFYIFFEAMLIPMYFLIGGFGDRAHADGEEEAATPALVRRGEVPALQPGRRPDHAGRGDRAVRGHRAPAGHRDLLAARARSRRGPTGELQMSTTAER